MTTQELLFISDRPGSITIAQGQDKGYLAKIVAVEPVDWVLYKDKKQEVLKQLSKEKKGLQTRAFVDSLHKNATIKRTEESQRASQELPVSDIF